MKSGFKLTAALLAAGLVGIGIAPVQLPSFSETPQLVQTLTSQQISARAKEFTVRIDGQDYGSGAIVGRNGNTYAVLTNWHVVKEPGQYTVQTSDDRSHSVSSKKKIRGADLAVVYFTSNNEYSIAERGSSDELAEGQTVHLAGYPAPQPGASVRTYRFYSENLIGFLSQSDIKDGYELIYGGAGLPGLSGSPVLNSNGQLIGINGKVVTEGNTGQISLYGIPTNTASRLAIRTGIDLGKPETVSSSSSPPNRERTIQPPTEPTLISAVTGVNYTSLRDLLAAGKWREADEKTTELMLKAAGRESEGDFSVKSIEEFSCSDLKTIDSLWVKYSSGRFGFSVQNRIYLETGNKPGEYDQEASWRGLEIDQEATEGWRSFGDRVGWRKGGKWLSYDDRLYNTSANRGHLPSHFYFGQRVSLLLTERIVYFMREWLYTVDVFELVRDRFVNCSR